MAKPASAATYAAQSRANQAEESRQRYQRPEDDPNASLYKTWEKLKAEAKKRRDPWVGVWQEMYRFTLPLREGHYSEAPAQDHSDQIYDETAVTGLPKLASRLAAGYVPEFGEIFSLEYGVDAPPHLLNGAGQAKLDQLTHMIHQSWQNSNLGIEIGEAMIDLAMGTTNILLEPGYWPGDVCFTSVDSTGLALLPGGKGEVKGWFWWRRIALEDVKVCYPKAVFNEQIERALKNDPRQQVLVECAQWRMSSTGADEKYQFAVVLPDFKKMVYERVDEGEGSCAWGSARWSKVGRDVWGRGPVNLAMPAILSANLTVQMTFENAEFSIGGMWTYDDDGVFDPDSVTFQPGTFIPKSREGKVERLDSGGREFNLSELVLADQRQNIKKALFIDEMDSPGDTPYSAYETAQRRADIARDLASPGSRITHELIVPLVNRTIWIFEKQGILNAAGLRVDGKRLKINPKSPFLRGQDAVFMQEMMTGAGQMNAIFGAGTSGMMFKLEETGREIFMRNGIPLRLKNTTEDLKAMGQQGGATMGEATGPGAPAAGSDPMALLAPIMKMGQQ